MATQRLRPSERVKPTAVPRNSRHYRPSAEVYNDEWKPRLIYLPPKQSDD
jgi:hypothetical protein